MYKKLSVKNYYEAAQILDDHIVQDKVMVQASLTEQLHQTFESQQIGNQLVSVVGRKYSSPSILGHS